MRAVEGTAELLRVHPGEVLVASDDTTRLWSGVTKHPEAGLHERLSRLAVPRVGGGFTVRVHHSLGGPTVHVCTAPIREGDEPAWRRASTGVRKAVLLWYTRELVRQRRAGLTTMPEDGAPRDDA